MCVLLGWCATLKMSMFYFLEVGVQFYRGGVLLYRGGVVHYRSVCSRFPCITVQFVDAIINAKLSEGWQPYGDLVISRHEELKFIWTQPMVKRQNPVYFEEG